MMTQTNSQSLPHYRLTLDELKKQFQAGLIKATTYLLYLIKSTRRDGWKFRIPNVRQFCLDHGLSKSTFYRAKAQLISVGLLREEIVGAVDLWIPGKDEPDDRDEIFSEPEKSVPTLGHLSQSLDSVSHLLDSVSQGWESDRPQTLIAPESQEASRSSTDQINSLSLVERETGLTGKKADKIPQSETIDPEFRQWLIEKAHQLPQFPTFPDRWIAAQARREDIKAQYLKESRGDIAEVEQNNVPPPLNTEQIEMAITQAHLQGDRHWINEKLVHLFELGYVEELIELCQLNKAWGFKVSSQGVTDRISERTTKAD